MRTREFFKQDNIAVRLDVYISKATGLTRSYIKQLIKSGNVLIDGTLPVKSGIMLKGGEIITLGEPSALIDIVPQNLPLDIIFEDKHIALINKEARLCVHPTANNNSNTLVNALLFHLRNLSSINGVIRPGIVHRLDKDTTGIMVVAKTNEAHLKLSEMFAKRQVKKTYRALLEGVVKDDRGEIFTAISRSKTHRKKMEAGLVAKDYDLVYDDGGVSKKAARNALSFFKVLKRFDGYTYVEFNIITGRTHQIRVHARHIGHPVVSDRVYGYKKQRFKGYTQFLHSYSLEFNHPVSGEKLELKAPLPKDFEYVLAILKNDG